MVSVTDPLGNATTYAYNPAGDRATVTDPLGNTTSYEYDTRHRVTKVTHPGGAFRTTTYNCCLKTAETDENGNQTQYQYDPNSRLAKVIDALGGQTQYVTHDQSGFIHPAGDTEGLIQGILAVTKDRETSLQMGAIGQEECRTLLSPARTAKELIAIYRKLRHP